MQFYIISRPKAGKKIPESSRLEFLEKISERSQIQKTTPQEH